MKKTLLYFVGITFIALTLTSCGTTKKGCGLTSEAQKIEQSTTVQKAIVSEVK